MYRRPSRGLAWTGASVRARAAPWRRAKVIDETSTRVAEHRIGTCVPDES